VVLVLVFVVFAGDSGMSLSEYKETAGGIHSRVGDTLGDISAEFEGLLDLEGMEDMEATISSFAAAGEWVDDASAVLVEGLEELEAIEPPAAAESLHGELIAFYEDGMDLLGEWRSFILYMEELLTPIAGVVAEMDGFDAALMDASSVEEVLAVVQGMKEYIVLSLEDLAAISPPGYFGDQHRRIVSLWEELGTVLDELVVAIETEDLALIEQLEARMSTWEASWDELGIEFDDLGNRFYLDLEDMAEEGAEFMDRIEAL
jgi:hypothetical protein